MNTFNRGDKVLFDNPYTCLIGTVSDVQQIGDRTGCVVGFVDADHHGEPSHIWADRLVKLPDDALMLRRGDLVRVDPDTSFCAGQYGTVANPEFHGDLFGYWLDMDGDRFWIPAGALIPAEGGGAR